MKIFGVLENTLDVKKKKKEKRKKKNEKKKKGKKMVWKERENV